MEYSKKFDDKAVYVRAVPVSELDDEVREEMGDLDFVYAVCNSKGKPLAIVDGERLAHRFARDNNFKPFHLN